MMVVLDATILLPVIWSAVPAPIDPATGKPVDMLRERVNGLIADLQRRGTKVVIPTPALSEILVRAGGAAHGYVQMLSNASAVKIEAFDERAAVEVAMMTNQAISEGDKRGRGASIWAKVKYDRQIVAIAKVIGATAIYSDDPDIRTFGEKAGIKVLGAADLPIPDDARQASLDLDAQQKVENERGQPEAPDDATGEVLGGSAPTGGQPEQVGSREDSSGAGPEGGSADTEEEDDEGGLGQP